LSPLTFVAHLPVVSESARAEAAVASDIPAEEAKAATA
jgi:hypothetical protein